jgi:hypothetical protein
MHENNVSNTASHMESKAQPDNPTKTADEAGSDRNPCLFCGQPSAEPLCDECWKTRHRRVSDARVPEVASELTTIGVIDGLNEIYLLMLNEEGQHYGYIDQFYPEPDAPYGPLTAEEIARFTARTDYQPVTIAGGVMGYYHWRNENAERSVIWRDAETLGSIRTNWAFISMLRHQGRYYRWDFSPHVCHAVYEEISEEEARRWQSGPDYVAGLTWDNQCEFPES